MYEVNTPSTIPTLPNPALARIPIARPTSAPIAPVYESPASFGGAQGIQADMAVKTAKQVKPQLGVKAPPARARIEIAKLKADSDAALDALAKRAAKFSPANLNADLGDATPAKTISKFYRNEPARKDTAPSFQLPVREALIMLNRDIPRVIDIITTKQAAYPNGYLAGSGELAALLKSPLVISIFNALKTSGIQNLPLPSKLPKLAIPRTAYIMSAIVTALEARGVSNFNAQAVTLVGETQSQTAIRIQNTITDLLEYLLPETELESLLPYRIA